jgi:hypothetical protein
VLLVLEALGCGSALPHDADGHAAHHWAGWRRHCVFIRSCPFRPHCWHRVAQVQALVAHPGHRGLSFALLSILRTGTTALVRYAESLRSYANSRFQSIAASGNLISKQEIPSHQHRWPHSLRTSPANSPTRTTAYSLSPWFLTWFGGSFNACALLIF